MPNWCCNQIKVSKKVADMVVSTIKCKDGEDKEIVDFNKLVPMPESVRHTTSGSNDQNNAYYFISNRLKKTPEEVWKSKRGRLLFAGKDALYYKASLEELTELAKNTAERVEEEKKHSRYIIGSNGKPLHNEDGSKIPAYRITYKEGQKHVQNYERYGAATWYEWACMNWGTKWNASDSKVTHLKGGKVELVFWTAWAPPEHILYLLSREGNFTLSYEIENNGYGTVTYKNGKIEDKSFHYWYERRARRAGKAGGGS